MIGVFVIGNHQPGVVISKDSLGLLADELEELTEGRGPLQSLGELQQLKERGPG